MKRNKRLHFNNLKNCNVYKYDGILKKLQKKIRKIGECHIFFRIEVHILEFQNVVSPVMFIYTIHPTNNVITTLI